MKMCPIYLLVLIFLFQSNFSAFINPRGSLVIHLKCDYSRPHVFAHEFNEPPQISQCLTQIQHFANQVLMMIAFCELSCKAIRNFFFVLNLLLGALTSHVDYLTISQTGSCLSCLRRCKISFFLLS